MVDPEPTLPHPDIMLPVAPIEAPGITDSPQRGRLLRILRPLLLVLTGQYAIVLLIGLSAAGTVRALVLPQILTRFETITAALKRMPF